MTIEEAIRTIQQNLLAAPKPYSEALQLAIEALERLSEVRGKVVYGSLIRGNDVVVPLSGEEQ